MTPKVSICIPTFNRKDYLLETLESVLAQTYPDYEIVIVDDGSTDGTGDMIRNNNYAVRYYWQQNSGDAAARNKLIELAKGRYITFIDSDDLLLPDAVERMAKVTEAEKEPVVVYGPYIRIDELGNDKGTSKRILRSGNITRYLFEDILVHSCGSMFPKKILQEAGGFDTSLPVCSDYDLWLRLSMKYRFIALKEPTFKRRRHDSNLSMRSFANRKTELNMLEDFYFNGGGKEVIPRHQAMKKLSREGYRAGRCAAREGLQEAALQLLRQSFYRHPNCKSLLWWVIAAGKLYPSLRKK